MVDDYLMVVATHHDIGALYWKKPTLCHAQLPCLNIAPDKALFAAEKY